ncbi:hypothetical protein [Streptomyces malaysiensis]|uniref:hypothetical protein n=1 Tax=Streptomyces malaysiensis TaxID=92644 RepID=UPI001AD91BB2|nr:hypothetical protein [Streptomyces malaysiensis]
MTYLIIIALATFFAWECLLSPLVRLACQLIRAPDLVAAYIKSLAVLAIALALDRWVAIYLLVPTAAASLAGMLTVLRRSSDRQKVATVVRGRANRGMPTPGSQG